MVCWGPLVAAETVDITVVASAAGRLDAWIDVDGDGSWSASEQIFTDQALVAGANVFTGIAIPAVAKSGTTFARFRFSSSGGLAPEGLSPDGEVEDYQILIGSPQTFNNQRNRFDVDDDRFVDNLDVIICSDNVRLGTFTNPFLPPAATTP